MIVLQFLTALLGAIVLVAQNYKPKDAYDTLQDGRKAIATGDVASVNGRIDRLLSVHPETASTSGGVAHSEITEERICSVCGMAVTGRSNDPPA